MQLVQTSKERPLQIVNALTCIHKQKSNKEAKAVDLATAANIILTDLFIEFAGTPGTNVKRQIATMTILSLFAQLIDGYLNTDLGRSGRSINKRKWRATSSKLLSALSPEDRRSVKYGAKSLENDFRSSLQANQGAQAISSELGGLCLAVCVQYPKRHQPSSDYVQTKDAVLEMIRAFERRVVSRS